jgi:hypothetical protein
MERINITASGKQLSKLRNGHRVRVKPAMKGEGIGVIVSPETYNALTKTFRKGKGAELALSPPEIMANKEVAPEMEGQGIFGPAVDRWLEKKGIKKAVYKIGDQLKPAAKTALIGALTAGGASLAASNPALVPYIPGGVASLSALGLDYLDNPDSYFQSNAGGTRARKARSMVGRVAQDRALEELNTRLGTDMGALDRNAIAQAVADKAEAEVAKQRYHIMDPRYVGSGLYAGSGLYLSSGRGLGLGVGGERGIRRQAGSVGLGGAMVGGAVGMLPPALQSQPYGANFQWRHTLPVQYQMK